jgi:hypothetical protein
MAINRRYTYDTTLLANTQISNGTHRATVTHDLPIAQHVEGWLPNPEDAQFDLWEYYRSMLRGYAVRAAIPAASGDWAEAAVAVRKMSCSRRDALKAIHKELAAMERRSAYDPTVDPYPHPTFRCWRHHTPPKVGLRALERDGLILLDDLYDYSPKVLAVSPRAEELAIAYRWIDDPEKIVAPVSAEQAWRSLNETAREVAIGFAAQYLRRPASGSSGLPQNLWVKRTRRTAAAVRSLENRGLVVVTDRDGDIWVRIPEGSPLVEMVALHDSDTATGLLLAD